MVTSPLYSQPRDDLETRRIRYFKQRYGSDALKLVCHAAFPLTLTTDLIYCLRENFVLECPWYNAADVLLSGLCSPIGYDLYEIEGTTRDRLLRLLIQEFGESCLFALEDFMVAYIRHRLDVEQGDRARVLGDRPHWTALACLRSQEAIQVIQQDLRQVIAGDDPKERLRLAAMVEKTADVLSESDFKPLLLDWANRTAKGEAIDESSEAAIAATQAGIVLKTLVFEVTTLVLKSEPEEPPEDRLIPFEFETVMVNDRGEITRRRQGQAFYFAESLAEQVPPLQMVAIPGGTFLMGSPEDELKRYDNENPQHTVTVLPFFISRYPVTQAQWRAIARLPKVNRKLKLNPSYFKGDDHPVEQVKWHEAVECCDRLSHHTGRIYRLPTEAEWEYACRAGTTTPFHFGETITADLANYNANFTYGLGLEGEDREMTTPVDHFNVANAFGLCDMHGNVWEWCLDHWHNNYEGAPTDGSVWLEEESNSRVIRGGSWDLTPRNCRSACRDLYNAKDANYFFGFRVVCVVPRILQ
jgi:formylglycine-generating enzyme required for sulfatase activity